jgi:hypothetical protein
MKILFVCQQYIHAARWINQLKETAHEIYVFDCLDKPIHPDLLWTNYITNWSKRKIKPIKGEYFLYKKLPRIHERIKPLLQVTASEKLIEIIEEIQPDLVHTLEMQSQAYHVLKAKEKLDFKWAYFCWGNDLYYFKDQPYHAKKIKKVLSNIDYFFADNTKDIDYVKDAGYSVSLVSPFPGGGGYDFDKYQRFKTPVAQRKLIIIKGYDHWTGRALKVLDALESIVDQLAPYTLYVYSCHDSVVEKIKELNDKYDVKISYSSRYDELPQASLLEKFGEALIAIGNNISDGIPNTLLEAMILGAFPIQSNPRRATEDYIEDGINGLLIENPEDSKEIAAKILVALKNKNMIESAFTVNQSKTQHLEYHKVAKKVRAVYHKIESEC